MTISIDMTNLATRSVVHQLQLKHALKLYAKTGMLVTRGATPKRLLEMATGHTGRAYKNTPAGRDACVADLQAMIDETKAARDAIAAAAL